MAPSSGGQWVLCLIERKNDRGRGSEAGVGKQGQVAFGMLYALVSRVLTLPAFVIAVGL